MKAAIFSDTHSNTARMVEAVRQYRPDVIIHLGDHDRDTAALKREFPQIPLYSVCGNCDVGSAAPLAAVVPLGPVKAYICHGHQYRVDWGELDSLVYAAQERGCGLVLFGHTHRPYQDHSLGMELLNPGSIGLGYPPGYGILTIENGAARTELRSL